MMNAMITKMIKKTKNYFKDFQCVAGSVLHNDTSCRSFPWEIYWFSTSRLVYPRFFHMMPGLSHRCLGGPETGQKPVHLGLYGHGTRMRRVTGVWDGMGLVVCIVIVI